MPTISRSTFAIRAGLHALFVAGALALSGCGALDAHCDFKDNMGKVKRCQERLGSIANEGFKATGNLAGGFCSNGPCARDGVVGGCFLGNQGDGSKVNDWYYTGTVDEVKKTCADDKGTFITP